MFGLAWVALEVLEAAVQHQLAAEVLFYGLRYSVSQNFGHFKNADN